MQNLIEQQLNQLNFLLRLKFELYVLEEQEMPALNLHQEQKDRKKPHIPEIPPTPLLVENCFFHCR